MLGEQGLATFAAGSSSLGVREGSAVRADRQTDRLTDLVWAGKAESVLR